MNNIVAHLLCNLTSSMRFEGSLNTDLNEITTNLVPFPRMHFLLSSLAPLHVLSDVDAPLRDLDHAFTSAFSRRNQLMRADPRQGLLLAAGLLVRGDVLISDVTRNVERLRPTLRMPTWNQDGFKVGLCGAPPLKQPYGLLALSNNTAIAPAISDLGQSFQRLYRGKAYVHHYTQFMEEARLAEAGESLQQLVDDYESIERTGGYLASEG